MGTADGIRLGEFWMVRAPIPQKLSEISRKRA
jgi:hypothetical protein